MVFIISIQLYKIPANHIQRIPNVQILNVEVMYPGYEIDENI